MSATSESTEHSGDSDGDGSQSYYSRDSEFFIDVKPLYLRVSSTFCVVQDDLLNISGRS